MMELRKYQIDHLGLVRKAISEGNRKIILQAPTGSGKTICAASIAKSAIDKGNNVLFLVNRRDLVYQCRDRFGSFGLGADIGLIMSGEETDFSSSIMIATIQTYHRRAKLDDPDSNFWMHNAQIVIVDEAHSSVCQSYMSVLDLYKDSSIILGLTATPVRLDGRGLGRVYDKIVSSADVRDLTSLGYLVPMTYYAPSKPDLSKIKTVLGDYDKKQLGDAMDKPKLVGDILQQWSRIGEGRQTLIFAVNVKHSLAIKYEFEKFGIPTEHVDAHTKTEERREIYRRFENGDTRVLTNVGIATEGTDFPWISCIIIARPTKSFAKYIQMAGRGLRPHPGKKDCILIDHSGVVDAHGFVDDPVEWTLDDKAIAWAKKKKRVKEQKIMTCKNCMFMFTGSVCPRCGQKVKNYGRMIATTEDDLKLVKGRKKQSKKAFKTLDKRTWYAMFLSEKERLGKSDKWLLAQYKSKFGAWPRNMHDVKPILASNECKSWLTHQRIKYFKGREKNINRELDNNFRKMFR